MDEETGPGLDREALDHLLTWVQDGVVSRRQLVGFGARPYEVRRLLRRGELVLVHPGVYVNHNGPLTFDQRRWASVHAHWPAALARQSALPDPPRAPPVHVAIDRKRTVKPVLGVAAHRTANLDDRVNWGKSPPVMTLEHAAIDVAATQTDVVAMFAVLADVVQTRETTAKKIAAVLRTRRIRHRGLLLELLSDLQEGACSVLEREYLLLERRHGLPTTNEDGVHRQARVQLNGRSAYRDVEYRAYQLVVELDGRAFHDSAQARDRGVTRVPRSGVTS